MIRVLFFGGIADRMGKQSCELVVEDGMTIAEVVATVGCATMQPLLVAINQEQVNDMGRLVKHGDEVALMPPFSGG